jgi:uncharacterized protein (UPF0332 family)
VPNTSEHLDRARQNVRFAETFDLTTTPYRDWVVTAYFYAALHLVEALLYAREGLGSKNHTERKEFIRDKGYLTAIEDPYRLLKVYSENARYKLYPFTSLEIRGKIIPHYRRIESYILPQLPRNASNP